MFGNRTSFPFHALRIENRQRLLVGAQIAPGQAPPHLRTKGRSRDKLRLAGRGAAFPSHLEGLVSTWQKPLVKAEFECLRERFQASRAAPDGDESQATPGRMPQAGMDQCSWASRYETSHWLADGDTPLGTPAGTP
jgi:hypothetical protein